MAGSRPHSAIAESLVAAEFCDQSLCRTFHCAEQAAMGDMVCRGGYPVENCGHHHWGIVWQLLSCFRTVEHWKRKFALLCTFLVLPAAGKGERHGNWGIKIKGENNKAAMIR